MYAKEESGAEELGLGELKGPALKDRINSQEELNLLRPGCHC